MGMQYACMSAGICMNSSSIILSLQGDVKLYNDNIKETMYNKTDRKERMFV